MFPSVADAARLITTLSAAVKVGTDGRAADVTFQVLAGNAGNGEIFKTPVEKNLRDAKYSVTCAGKTVTLVFDFIYATRSERVPGLQMVTFVAPNRFEISVAPRVVDVLNYVGQSRQTLDLPGHSGDFVPRPLTRSLAGTP